MATYVSRKFQFPQDRGRGRAPMDKLDYMRELARFCSARRRIYDSKLNAFARAMYRTRLNNVLKKVRAWFYQGHFADDHYSLPKGWREVKSWAVFYEVPWGYRDKSDEAVKFFTSQEKALDFAETCGDQLHSIMETETGKEYMVKFTATLGDPMPNRCEECFSTYNHVKGCVNG